MFGDIKSVLDREINKQLNAKLDKLCEKLKSQLAEEHHSYVDSVVNEQRYPVHVVIRLNLSKKQRAKKELSQDIRCQARIGLGTQCSRSRTDGVYCKSHNASLPYGNISSVNPNARITKKRGRRGKAAKECSLESLNMDMYVQAILIKIGEESYFLDQYNVLYSLDVNNEIIGYVEDDEVHWY